MFGFFQRRLGTATTAIHSSADEKYRQICDEMHPQSFRNDIRHSHKIQCAKRYVHAQSKGHYRCGSILGSPERVHSSFCAQMSVHAQI
ncbi:MAG: hypothetical protein QOC81_3279 [Thermoanaerobaculia bacterium]|nr:hypothetical protein [Thermoanaerobaculia bacterium]